MIYKKSKATVLIFTLLVLSVILVLTQQLIKSVMVGSVFDKMMIQKEQAEVLALSGINLAISQLVLKEDEKQSKDETDKKFKEWLLKILPNLNRWQTFDLSEELDGISGKIKISISCENGKININDAFDFEKQEFKKEYDFLLKGLEIKGKLPAGQIYDKLTEYFKKRERKLDDVTEILNTEDLDVLNIFYNPPREALPGKKAQPNVEISLQDLFTIWTSNEKIEPLMLSDSMRAIFDLRRPEANDSEKLNEIFKKVADSFKKDWGKNWNANWDLLLPIYDKKPKILNAINKLLSQEFGVQVYSVLSCGIVGDVECKLLAILKKVSQQAPNDRDSSKNEPQGSQKEKGEDSKEELSKKEIQNKDFKVVRIYWL